MLSPAPKKVAFHTLGCKLNYSETSSISRLFEEQGYEKVPFESPADVYVINTCSVTVNADRECKQVVKSALDISPEAFVVVVGCYAQLKPQEIANIEGVDLVLGAAEKFKLLNYLNDLQKKTQAEIFSCEIDEANFFVDAYSFGDRTRAFLKVQDGCDYPCTYCTIPLARGKSRSDSIINVVKNAQEIASRGIKEVVLTGVNIGDFGKAPDREVSVQELMPATIPSSTGLLVALDEAPTLVQENKPRERFLDLVTSLDEVSEIKRFRISSIEPNLLKNEVIEFVAQSQRFVPHFHIPLQSGNNKQLKQMKRRYLRELYADRVAKIKSLMPHCCIGVDVIVGFPGETDEDFLATYDFVKNLDISYLHVFTYSERDNTEAAHFKPVVPIAERKKRNKMLRILSVKKQRAFYEQHLGTERVALIEAETKGNYMFGFTDNYIRVKLPYNESFVNQLIRVKLKEMDVDGKVLAEVIG